MTVSDEILKRTAEAYRRIRNTARFLLANLDGFDPKTHIVPANEMLALDQWIVKHAQSLQAEIVEHYEQYNFHSIYQKLHNFCVVELGGFYLDIIKDRQYTSKGTSVARRSAQTAMFHIAEAFTRWLAPITSFTADEIWQHLPGDRPPSVMIDTWYEGFPEFSENDNSTVEFWQQLMTVRTEVNKLLEAQRKAGTIGAPLEAEVTLFVDGALYNTLASIQDELKICLNHVNGNIRESWS